MTLPIPDIRQSYWPDIRTVLYPVGWSVLHEAGGEEREQRPRYREGRQQGQAEPHHVLNQVLQVILFKGEIVLHE